MKKLIAKIRRQEQEAPSRITNETVAEHREKILAGGRRFKYPVQYARHKLVVNAVVISVSALVLLAFVGWWQLYPMQNTSTFMYRVTMVLPLPVASVDGQSVPYRDYLMKYRSSAYYLQNKEQVNLKSEDGKKQLEQVRQQAMQDAVADAYAVKLASQEKITVTAVELEAFLKLQRQSSDGEVSQQTYDAVVMDYYNWSPDEYRYATKNKLLRQKVAYAVDKDASTLRDTIAPLAKASGSRFQDIVSSVPAVGGSKAVYGTSGWVPKTNQDGGLADAAAQLERGGVSDVIKSTTGDGYYLVRLLDINETQVSYEYIQIPLTSFKNSLEAINKAGKVSKYISIPEAEVSLQAN